MYRQILRLLTALCLLGLVPAFAARVSAGSGPLPSAVTNVAATTGPARQPSSAAQVGDDELMAIFEQTYGIVERRSFQPQRPPARRELADSYSIREQQLGPDYLLVDGCNIIFAWVDLRDLAQADFHAAQSRLMDILSDYQGIKGCILILVFDAYRVEGHPEETFQYHNIHVVYTKEAETADQYIERTVHKIGRKHNVTVATSDGLEQIIIMGQGAARISARGFKDEIASAKQQMREEWQERRDNSKTYLFDSMTPELKSHMEDIRLGRKKKEEL